MADPIEHELRSGRLARNAGRLADAEQAYARAAELARNMGAEEMLAHSLRHVSDIARERGEPDRALAAAVEAVSLYRAGTGSSLDLANALRVNALALNAVQQGDGAAQLWREARSIYERLDIGAGIEECDANIDKG